MVDTPVKRELEVSQEGSARIKRECEDAAGGRGTGKKAKKEVIVLDDWAGGHGGGVHVKRGPNEGMAGKRAQRKTNKNMIALDD
jgi:hypothetical protein